MCGLVDHYAGLFAHLETEPLPDRWPAATTFRSPGKALLLMAVLDLIAHRQLHRNFVEPSPQLVQRFAGCVGCLPSDIGPVNLAQPFIGLQAEEFWHLRPRAAHDPVDPQAVTTVERLREYCFGAVVSENLFPLLQMRTSREKLRTVLLESYFSLEVRQRLRDHSCQPVICPE